MRNAVVCLILAILLLSQEAFAQAVNKPPAPKFDYSKYLAPKAWQSIQDSQGVLFAAVPTFGGPKCSLTQALVFDAKKGLLLSVAHGISEYPQVAFGKETVYAFICREKVYPCELINLSVLSDIAIFKVKKGDLSRLKAVIFAKKTEALKEYYSFSQRVKYSQGDFEITDVFPWKAVLVRETNNVTVIPLNIFMSILISVETLVFDKSIVYGFSGSGVFNDRGEVVGMLTASMAPGGFSVAVSANTMKDHIDKYMASEKEKEDKKKAEQAATAKKVAKPVDKPKKK